MEKEKTQAQILSDNLLFKQKHIADCQTDAEEKAQKFCEGYKSFLNSAKTEREAVKTAVAILEKN
ncbi:MAG: aminopeptidase, partial [Oscillospiraceae bacterium]